MRKHDLHIHSSYSDGLDPPLRIIEAAKEKQLELIAITDHAPELSVGIKPFKIPSLLAEVKRLQKEEAGVQVLLGMEANVINLEGAIDLDELVLKQLDFVIAGIHYVRGVSSPKELAHGYLQRAFNVIKRHHFQVLAHPFFLHRDLLPFLLPEEIEEFLDLAISKGVAMEVNVKYRNPSDEFIRQCLHHGIKFSVGSDAHRADEVGDIEWALGKLRKVGATKEDLIAFNP
jgi:histidinol phosphatase-like PHP family hydrolase